MRLEREAEFWRACAGETRPEDFLERPGEEGAELRGGGVIDDLINVGVLGRLPPLFKEEEFC